jgi:acetyl-CoA carboxylase biotin carboxyl carrier protein
LQRFGEAKVEGAQDHRMTTPSFAVVEKIIELFNKSGAAELEYSCEGLSFKIRRAARGSPASSKDAVRLTSSEAESLIAEDALASSLPARSSDERIVVAFMHGVFHRSSAPGEKPFVEVGSEVRKDQQIGILEAMKVFMPVVAPIDGTVAHIHIDNAVDVASDQALFTIVPQDGGAT